MVIQGGIDLVLHSVTLPDAHLRRNALKLLYRVMKNNGTMFSSFGSLTLLQLKTEWSSYPRRAASIFYLVCLRPMLKRGNMVCNALLCYSNTVLQNGNERKISNVPVGECRSTLQFGRDLIIECTRDGDPITSKFANMLLTAIEPRNSPQPVGSGSFQSFSRPLSREQKNNVHVNTIQY